MTDNRTFSAYVWGAPFEPGRVYEEKRTSTTRASGPSILTGDVPMPLFWWSD
jgi:hypothetical protein